MRYEDLYKLGRAQDSEECAKVMKQLVGDLGFNRFSMFMIHRDTFGRKVTSVVADLPEGYDELWRNPSNSERDPISGYCRYSFLPIAWGKEDYERARAMDLYEEQEPFGFLSGVAVAHHAGGDKHFMIGLDRDVPFDRAMLTASIAEVCLLGCHAYAWFEGSVERLKPVCPLSPREIECLKWAMEGKSAWETGVILGLAEDTVAKHLGSACRKLDCSNRVHAVAKALRFGYIG